MINPNSEAVCHVCGQIHSDLSLCEGCNKLACEDHYTKALCDTCMAKVESLEGQA
ncbi:hypothetical protein [Pelosinus baikalensis]|uniref:Orotate phosphoribosyltransferase n=1 Tax=Pelosinus baikalensis TaxID=2892015 RepID=A0ABS8HZF1_9FIRM|nr:hypothetical protein [Pelosinus baikalensis]MCC5467648.1 hypothetical protein [Pelosinus baikalensis]